MMRVPTSPGRIIFASALIVACPAAAEAQLWRDSTHVDAGIWRQAAAWASLGIGTGNIRGETSGSFAYAARGTVSVGPVLLAYRGEDVGPYIGAGPGVRSDAVLVGARTGGQRLFASAAVGYAHATSYHQCDSCSLPTLGPGVETFAYDVMLHANAVVPGLALGISGLSGPAGVAHSDVTVSFELGWFGFHW